MTSAQRAKRDRQREARALRKATAYFTRQLRRLEDPDLTDEALLEEAVDAAKEYVASLRFPTSDAA